MYKTISVLRDVVLEARLASKDLEYDDPLVENLRCIEELTNTAIDDLSTQIGGIDAV